MPTRLKRPPFWRHLALTCAMAGFLTYLGYSALSGQFGIESREDILAEISVLEGRSSALQAQIDAHRMRAALFDTRKLDPDILDEKARELLNMANASDILVMVDPATGQPRMRGDGVLAENQLTSILAGPAGL